MSVQSLKFWMWIVLAAPVAWCQSTVGSISGEVTDSSGAAIPNCMVTATNVGTGLKQTWKTQENGRYVFASLPEGTYNVRVEKEGFRPSEQSGVVLDAASRRLSTFISKSVRSPNPFSVSAAVEQVQTSREMSAM